MNKYQEIGGYFALELKSSNSYPHKSALHLQSARSAIKLIIKTHNIKEIYIPYFTCKSVLEAIKHSNCKIKFYSINEDLSPKLECSDNHWIIYNDYFGINSKNIKKITKKYKNIIIDNAQSFFAKRSKICFYSPRKFIGVSDGGILYDSKSTLQNIQKDYSLNRAKYLFSRLEGGAEYGYKDFLDSEKSLDLEPIKTMSNLTYSLLNAIDYKTIKQKRVQNYNYLNSVLKKSIKPFLETNEIPMIYPYFGNKKLRENLIKNKIFVATYWRDLELWCKKNSFELHLRDHLIALPIDQRYEIDSMDKIISVINGGGEALDECYKNIFHQSNVPHFMRCEVYCA